MPNNDDPQEKNNNYHLSTWLVSNGNITAHAFMTDSECSSSDPTCKWLKIKGEVGNGAINFQHIIFEPAKPCESVEKLYNMTPLNTFTSFN